MEREREREVSSHPLVLFSPRTISDSYLVASGLPKKNGDAHAAEICSMALNLQASESQSWPRSVLPFHIFPHLCRLPAAWL